MGGRRSTNSIERIRINDLVAVSRAERIKDHDVDIVTDRMHRPVGKDAVDSIRVGRAKVKNVEASERRLWIVEDNLSSS